MRRNVWLVASTFLMVAAACGGDAITSSSAPKIEVSEGARPITNHSTISVSDQTPARITVANTGSGTLVIESIVVQSNPPGAFILTSLPMPTASAPVEVAVGGLEHEFSILLDATSPDARGTVTITTNKTIQGFNEFVFDISPEASVARLLVQPKVVDFGEVDAEVNASKPVALLNTGAAPLSITGFNFSGHPQFSVKIGEQTWAVTQDTASEGVVLDTPLDIGPGESRHIEVSYAAVQEEPAEASLQLHSNDPSGAAEVKLFANVQGPCINVNPARADFGGKLVGQTATMQVEIQSCGDRDLTIEAVQFFDDDGGMFTLNAQALGVYPVILAPNTSVYLPVSYTPIEVSPINSDGDIEYDAGFFRILSDAFLRDYDVEVRGFGTDGSCPIADIHVAEGEEVLPQTVLHLSGANSSSTTAADIDRYEWSVVAPTGSVTRFLPSNTVVNPSFEANVVGEYIFRLRVWDELGTESCDSASKVVFVTSDEAIHVELLWTTPGDIDETDEGWDLFGNSVGSDVDLHFTHPNAVGEDLDRNGIKDGWFDDTFDAYWANKTPDWGAFGGSDNPSLDRDDTDGGGPENLNLTQPENGKTYKVGVHYWDDHDFGVAFATVRVYVYGQKRFERERIQMNMCDMWEVATIDWPGGAIRDIGVNNVPRILHNYCDPAWLDPFGF